MLSRLVTTGVSLLPGPFAYPHIHTHLQPYLFLFPPMQTASQEFTRVLSFQPNTAGFILPFSLPLSRLCETWLPPSLYISLFDQSPYITNLSSPLPLFPPQECTPLLTQAVTCPRKRWLLHSPTLLCPRPWLQDSTVEEEGLN